MKEDQHAFGCRVLQIRASAASSIFSAGIALRPGELRQLVLWELGSKRAGSS